MQLYNHFLSLQNPPIVSRHHNNSRRFTCSSTTTSPKRAESLQQETLKSLEWPSLCDQLSPFAQTSMGLSLTKTAQIPFGRCLAESQTLLHQTSAALSMMQSQPLDLSKIEDISGIIDSAASGQLLSLSEICAVRRTLRAVGDVWHKLSEASLVDGDSSERYVALLEILKDCNFQMELEQKIGFCIDCNLSVILDRASEDLEIIRAERKRNMEDLESLLKEVSTRIFQAGGIDRPLITKRRSRMCVGIRATHKFLLPDGVVLNVSGSGATYFMEPKEAVELNNMEVRLSNLEKAEEMAILRLLTVEIAKSEVEVRYVLDRVVEVDLAFAKAGYAQWMNGVCPILGSENCESFNSGGKNCSLSINIEGIRHPLLLGSSLRSSSAFPCNSANSAQLDVTNGMMTSGSSVKGVSDFPIPIDIKIEHGTRVVVISGPNTGGKTASMKTLGLASLMSKAGMYLPARNCPRLPWFDLVLADIGDHQSLEQNLSTFSGHISQIIEILEIVSKESLVLIDEIGSGTDPSEGVALATSILHYLKGHVGLAIVTTHYADLSRLKDKDAQFENAAMEFSLETLQPTYRILWGNTGNSNALSIAKSIGFDRNIIERAKEWVERLRPEEQQQWKGALYQSLSEERSKLESQARRAASLHAEIMDLYNEIQDEAKDLDRREVGLKAKETQQVQKELKAAKSQIETVVQEFENQLKTATADQFNSLVKKSESAIASIVEAHCPADDFSISETNADSFDSFAPQFGELVHVKGLGDKLATVVEALGDDETVLVQYGKIRVRVKKSDIRAIPRSKRNTANSIPNLKKQGQKSQASQSSSMTNNSEEVSYGPRVQTSKNTVDLRGMQVEEAAHQLDMAISATESHSVVFVIHGMGTGVVKERALQILRNHPRVAKYEQESPMNYGCTVAYINKRRLIWTVEDNGDHWSHVASPPNLDLLVYTYTQTRFRELPHAFSRKKSCKLANFINSSVTTNKDKYSSFLCKGYALSLLLPLHNKPRTLLRFCKKMLAVFDEAIGKPPQEFNLIPSSGLGSLKSRHEIAEIFQSTWPASTLFNLSNGNFMAVSHEDESPLHPRSIVVMDDIFCIFTGALENMCELRRRYGLSRQATEAVVLIEAYKTLRDRAPYPPDQVIKDLQGQFAFVLFDAKSSNLFVARDRDGSVDFKWGMAGDGSLICSDDPKLMEEACGKSCTNFPPGCMLMNGSGLMSFDHPLYKVRAILREDDEGQVCGVTFQVDLLTRLHSIPRSGSAANWADAGVAEAE